MRDLIFAVSITPVLWWLISKTKGLFISLLIIAFLTTTPTTWHGLGFCFWFCIGSWIAITGKDLSDVIMKYRYIGYTILAIVFIPSVLYQGLETRIGYAIYPLLIASLVFTVVSMACMYVAKGHGKRIVNLSNTTFMIFALHFFLLPFITKGVNNYLTNNISVAGDLFAYLLIPVLTILLCVVLCRVMQRYTPKLMQFIGCR